MQLLGNLFEYLLQCDVDSRPVKDRFLTVLGATSGDTGSAAIHGLRGKKNITCFILYPRGKITDIQERQMTSVLDDNIFCISQSVSDYGEIFMLMADICRVCQGDFDDAQAIVKQAFADKQFREATNLAAINSINWARILTQITYYFYAWLRYV